MALRPRLAALVCSAFFGIPAGLAQQAPPVHSFFDGDRVHTIRLTFTEPNWYERLRLNFEGKADPDFAEAAFEWGDLRYEKIGVRFKGNSSYRTYPGPKKSFKLNFDKYVKDQEIDGLDEINLNNAFKDPSFVRERAYAEVAVTAGLAAPRVSYAALYINNAYWGLYFLTEEVDKRLLRSRFAEGDGNLYKGDPQGTLEWRGEAAAPYQQAYELKTNTKGADWKDLIRLIDILNRTPLDELPAKLEAVLDVRATLTWLAVDNATVNLDSYIGSGHNYYLYHRASDDRFVPIPWDANEAWGNFSSNLPMDRLIGLPIDFAGTPPPQAPPGVPQPLGPRRPLVARLLAVPQYRALYEEIYRKVLAEAVAPDQLLGRMAQLRDLIRPYVLDDTKKMFSNEQFEEAMAKDLRFGTPPPPQPVPQPPVPQMLLPGLDPFIRARTAHLMTATIP